MTADSSKDLSVWERLEQGRQAKADSGGYAGYGSPAFGQRSIDGELIVDPTESQTIELIRRHHKSGKSLQKIADWLNQQGYTTKRGQAWQRISVKRVLDRLYGKTPRIAEVNSSVTQDEIEITPTLVQLNLLSTQIPKI
jgi:Recombinase